MSLYINVDLVQRVLLADGWHNVEEESFDLDAYEFCDGDDLTLHGGGASGICSTGFSFLTGSPLARISGPLDSIIAVVTTHP